MGSDASRFRCGTCEFWQQNAPTGGRCLEIRVIPGSLTDYLVHPTQLGWDDPSSRPLQTNAFYGCLRWRNDANV